MSASAMARFGDSSPRRRSPLKKIVCAAEQDRPDIAAERTRWQEDQKQLDPKRLVFIDETWAKTNMAPTHGRCQRGQRLYAKVPQASDHPAPAAGCCARASCDPSPCPSRGY